MADSYATHHATVDVAANAADRLSRLHGASELHAALLALLLTPGSKRAARAWGIETAATLGIEGLREGVASLSGAARLPWVELLLSRMALQPLAVRKELLQATRRVMGARGWARPIDRLHWLLMRRGLGEVPPVAVRAEASVEVTEWLESDVLALAAYTAFLSRMIPGDAEDASAGAKWYASVMATWQPFADAPECKPPDTEGMLEALGKLQTMSWMQRPVIIRGWVSAALKHSGGARFDDLTADALRITCTLLDSPQPPELARHYITLAADATR
ncbi:MAG: hypothetical protein M3Y55_02360 [Pseudomonadota bacterium]|nr:hypothetical protein [Pseudomonadota bacterium]